jgi:hypothetical protein
VAGAGSSCPRPLTRCAGDDGSRTADSRLGLGALLRRDGDLDGARPHLLAAANAYRRTGEWLALARATYNLALTEPVGSGERRNGLVASWLAMQSISWGLPEVSARADWRDTLDDATASTLSSALDSNNLLLAAEIIEAMRSAPLAPDAVLPAGISAAGTTVHDLPATRPAAVNCGWSPRLPANLTAAEEIRDVSRVGIHLRTEVVDLVPLLLDAQRPTLVGARRETTRRDCGPHPGCRTIAERGRWPGSLADELQVLGRCPQPNPGATLVDILRIPQIPGLVLAVNQHHRVPTPGARSSRATPDRSGRQRCASPPRRCGSPLSDPTSDAGGAGSWSACCASNDAALAATPPTEVRVGQTRR